MKALWQNRRRLLTTTLLVGLVVVALAALIPDHETADLGGTAWALVAYGPADAPIPAEASASISFEANSRFGGSTGCNWFFGNYWAEEGRLDFVNDEVAMTLVSCDPNSPEGAQNAFFRAHLASGIDYLQTADRLILRFGDGQMAEYTRQP